MNFWRDNNLITTKLPQIRENAETVDKLARKEIQIRTDYLRDSCGLKALFGPELKVGIEDMLSQDKVQKYFQDRGDEFFYGKRCRLSALSGCLEFKLKKDEPLKLLEKLDYIKNTLLNIKDGEIDGVNKDEISFTKSVKDMHPHSHLNFSLWEGKKNIFARYKSNYPKLIVYLMNNLVKDLENAFYIFLFGEGTVKRFEVNQSQGFNCPDSYLWDRGVGDVVKASGSVMNIRDDSSPANPGIAGEIARVELRSGSSSGIDSLEMLFVLGSICASLDDLIQQSGRNEKTSPADLEKSMAAEKALPDLGTLCVNREKAKANFLKAEQRMRKIFGDEIYSLIA